MQSVRDYLNVGPIEPGTVVKSATGQRYTVIQLNSDLYALLDNKTYQVSKPTLCNNVKSFSSALGESIEVANTVKYIAPGNVIWYDDRAYLIMRKDNDNISLIKLSTYDTCFMFDSDLCIHRGVTEKALMNYFAQQNYNKLKFCSLSEYMRMRDC